MLSRHRWAAVALLLTVLVGNGCCWKHCSRPNWCGPRPYAAGAACAPCAPACCEPSTCYKPADVITHPQMIESMPPMTITPGK